MWVGFIALFGTAVQTGVVMVIYLDEAVERKRRELSSDLTRDDLRDAVMEGALLRLRPKVMTVSTVIAGLLPIMWSSSVGAEVMRPLATPVLGGMISSLAHVLVVTPVLFFWMRERQLGLQHRAHADTAPTPSRRRAVFVSVAIVLVVAAAMAGRSLWNRGPQEGAVGVAGAPAFQAVRAGTMEIVLRSATGSLKTGRNTFTIEFRSATGTPAAVQNVRATANMSMPGMVMSGNLRVAPSSSPGEFVGTADFGMAGAWQMRLDWDGPDGPGSVSFEGAVQ